MQERNEEHMISLANPECGDMLLTLDVIEGSECDAWKPSSQAEVLSSGPGYGLDESEHPTVTLDVVTLENQSSQQVAFTAG